MRKLFKKILPVNSKSYKFLSKVYRSAINFWLPGQLSAETVLHKYAAYNPNVYFIQIGSNDGITNDPLHEFIKKYSWSGILVEPVPSLFEKLKKNYLDVSNTLIFENSAISKKDGIQPFYRLKESDDHNLPVWYDQIGSFKKESILQHQTIPGFADLIIEEQINTTSFNTLLTKHNITNVNLIHIDTEGYDFEILKLIDYKKVNPDIVIYEYVHLSLTDFKNSLRLLKNNNYAVYSDQLDIVAINKNILSAIK